ncbi:MAG: SHOCT domain-containing protein, partial [Mesorhizobium sp.]
ERRDPPSRQSPIDILQERFAKGEIDQKEYDDRRRTLSGTH